MEYYDELNGRNIQINSKALDIYSKVNNLFFSLQVYYYNKYGLENDGESDPYVPKITKFVYEQLSALIAVYTELADRLFCERDKKIIQYFLHESKNSDFYCDKIMLEILSLLGFFEGNDDD